jgi:hypothetical protein
MQGRRVSQLETRPSQDGQATGGGPYHRIYASLYAIRNMLAPVRAHNFGLTSRLK